MPTSNQHLAEGASVNESLNLFVLRSDEYSTGLTAEVNPAGNIRFNFRNPSGNSGGTNIYSQTDVFDGNRHHCAFVKGDDDRLYLFIDGELEAGSEEQVIDFDNQPFEIFVGENTPGNRRNFRGLMDEIRF